MIVILLAVKWQALESGSMHQSQGREHSIEDPLVSQIALKLIQGLETVHARDLVHKDINPTNIAWNQLTGQIKLIDPGFASAPQLAKVMRLSRDVLAALHYICSGVDGQR